MQTFGFLVNYLQVACKEFSYRVIDTFVCHKCERVNLNK